MISKMVGASNERVRNPCATVPPNGLSFSARSTSTWIHCRSPVHCANSLMRRWSTVIHDETPISLPRCLASSAGCIRWVLMRCVSWLRPIEKFVDCLRRFLGARDQEQVSAVEHLQLAMGNQHVH